MYSPYRRKSNTPRNPDFARDIAASEFGPRYFGWREWADHQDIDPETLAEQRIRAIWDSAQ